MNILIAYEGVIPVATYGGIERVVWYLGKELVKMGHQVTYLLHEGSSCDFAPVLFFDKSKKVSEQIPAGTDVVHFNFMPEEEIRTPYLFTMHGNCNDYREFDSNTVFVSRNHANRYGSDSFVYNGLDWDDYGKPDLTKNRNYFHFLGNAAWRVKNVKGAINAIKQTRDERLQVLGGQRFNFKMGMRFTFSPRISFCGMVGGEEKLQLLNGSKGLVFPVRWHEPFGLAITESLYFGCPVFGTPYGSLPEIVNKEVGYLTTSTSDLAQALENSSSYSRSACHQYVVDVFSARKMAEAYLEKYQQVIEGKKLNAEPPRLKQVQTEKFLPWQ
ncbi:glycosyltransferase [Botryobacter ruber]|uniref:glycosyltransferase n=1 Tax=Botryobacter ruber TaxID=2171629 RepID=UPI000E0C7217|nr:glycosyltransferase [Botryobacter ruber]